MASRPGVSLLAGLLAGWALIPAASAAGGEARAGAARRLEEVTVTADELAGPFPRPVEDGKIYTGKKATVTTLADQPQVQANNYRQAYAQLPGLLVAEQAAPSHANLNYRGIGDPHETEYLLVLKDGIPITSDWIGYSTLYYQPMMESVERIEFIRGGGSLLYGPQPGPVLNYVTHGPPGDRTLAGRTQHVFGTDGLYSTYNSIGGTSGRVGYLGYAGLRDADGERPNADYLVMSGGLKLTAEPTGASRWTANLDAYSSESGEAGRLSLAQYLANRDFARTPNDRVWIERYVPSLAYEHTFSDTTRLVSTGWGGFQDRFSRRQTGTATNLDRQEFWFLGNDTRLEHAWDAWGRDAVTTAGFTFYASDSPRSRRRGAEPRATTGQTRFEMDRRTVYGAVFGEQLVRFGDLSVVPAFRLELIDLQVEELTNLDVTRPLISDAYETAEPLGALGLAYELTPAHALYGNVSQGYRPKEYDDLANPTSSTQLPPSDLDESRTWSYEAGLRGSPAAWWTYDASWFLVDYDNYIENLTLGGGNVERSNSGRAIYQGVELATSLELIGLHDALTGASAGSRWGRLELFGNLSLLEADFVHGANDGKDPAYAPPYLVRTGVFYALRDQVKASFTGQFVDGHYWQDSNAAGAVGTTKVAAYMVWDLEAEVAVCQDRVRLIAGINNLFDEDYYSRIRTDGIDPAAGRSYYAGVSFAF